MISDFEHLFTYLSFPGGSEGKASACKAGDLGSIPGSGRSPGEGNDNPLWFSCLENPIDGETWCRLQFAGLTKSQTRLSDFTFTYLLAFCIYPLCRNVYSGPLPVFKIELFGFFGGGGCYCYWVVGVPYILRIFTLYQVYALQIFFPVQLDIFSFCLLCWDMWWLLLGP